MKPNVKKDDDGLDNIDDFWDDDGDGEDDTTDQMDDGPELSSLPTRAQQRQRPSLSYLEQELPEELLSTPTSRRTRNFSMSKGQAPGSDRGLSLPVGGGAYDEDAEEYHSPSFQAVKKRLVFTEDSSDADQNQEEEGYRASLRALTGPSKKTSSTGAAATTKTTATTAALRRRVGSPALEQQSASREMRIATSITARGSPLKAPSSTRQGLSGGGAPLAQSVRTTSVSRPAGVRKAFELESKSRNSTGDSESAEDQEPERHTTPKRTPSKKASSSTANRTPAEFKRKGNKSAALPPPATKRTPVQEDGAEEEEEVDELEGEYDDYPEQDEPVERESVHDGRMAFSDEEAEQEEVDERGPTFDRRWLNYPPLPQKQPGQAMEVSRTINRPKAAISATAPKKKPAAAPATSKKEGAKKKAVPKGKKVASKKAPRGGRVAEKSDSDVNGEDEADEADTEDERSNQRVPSQKASTRRAAKSTVPGSETGRSKREHTKVERGNKTSASQVSGSWFVEVPVVPDAPTSEETGVRRSHRTKIAPLEFWRNERVIIERDEKSGPVIKAVLRAETPPLQTLKRKRSHKPNTKSNTNITRINTSSSRSITSQKQQRQSRSKLTRVDNKDDDDDDLDDDSDMVDELEDDEKEGREEQRSKEYRAIARNRGMEEAPVKKAEVIDYESRKPVLQVIAESKDSIQFKQVEGGQYLYHRGLEDAGSLVSGTFKIMPGETKPMTIGSGSSMVFVVTKGIVEVTVHETQFVVSAGGRFLVPRGNKYRILNLSSSRSCQLFFVQTKINDTDHSGSNNTDSGAKSDDAGQ
ncbi:hypothetical protein BGX34_003950 [Mortierella sp. NVP85]|nr:hypothetical protein BGX34_003950 [Mortierella sp. NVP85]